MEGFTIFRFLITVVVFLLSTYLFNIAATSLNPKKINLISFSYYSFMIYTFLGSSLALLGFRDHYLIRKISSEQCFIKTYVLVCLLAILFPLTIALVNKLLLSKSDLSYDSYLRTQLIDEGCNEKLEYVIVSAIFAMSALTTAIFYYRLGTFPIIGWFTGDASAETRLMITKTAFINEYVKNIIMLQFPAVFSYYTYIKSRTTRSKKWIFIFVLYFVLAVIAKTYNYEKAPLTYYLALYIVIEILLGRRFKTYHLIIFFLCASLLISSMYMAVSNEFPTLNIYYGPLSRIVFSQVAGLFHAVQIFPDKINFLSGASLPTAVAFLLGKTESWIRSGRVVMEYVNPDGIRKGTADVMNTVFIGESYANWGIGGVVAGIIHVALLVSFIHYFLLRSKKTTVHLTIFIVLFNFFIIAFQGGFVDFIYDAGTIINVASLLIIKFLIGNNIRAKSTM